MQVLLEIGRQNAVPPSGIVAVIIDGDGDLALLSSAGVTTKVAAATGVAGLTGDFVDNTDPANPVISATSAVTAAMLAVADAAAITAFINTATALLPGLMPAAAFAGQFRPHTSVLTDASVTVTPGTDKVGKYILPAGTLTQNRVLTLSDADVHLTQLVQVVCEDISANTFTIKAADTTTLFTKGASQGQPITFQFYHNGTAWGANTSWWST